MKHILLLLLPFIVLFAACKPAADSENDGEIRILATFLPVHAHAAAIAGDRAIVESLIAGDTGAHDFWSRPADMKRIAQADVLVFNGAGMEPWLDNLTKQAAKKNLIQVDLSKGIELVSSPPALLGHHHHGNCDHGEHNPHFWLDPILAIQQVETLRDALIVVSHDASFLDALATRRLALGAVAGTSCPPSFPYLASLITRLDTIPADFRS